MTAEFEKSRLVSSFLTDGILFFNIALFAI
mgnify:CR=1 FL=1